MNKDIRLLVTFFDHPKTVKLQRRLGDGAVLALQRLWCFAAQHKPDGNLCGMDAEDIEIAARWQGETGAFVAALTDLRWLDRAEDGSYLVHDWAVHNGYASYAARRSEAARNAANMRWEKMRGCPAMPEQCDGNAPALHAHCRGNAPSPSPSPSPSIPPEHSPSVPPEYSPRKKDRGGTSYPLVAAGCGDGRGGDPPGPPPPSPDEPAPQGKGNGSSHGPPPCPHQAIIALYHETLPELPRVIAWPETRQKHLAARWREAPERQDLDWWREFFRGIRQCPHLLGRNDRGWRADLPWMLKPEKFLGIIEGKYRRESRTVSEKTARTMANLDGVDLDAPAWSRP